MKIEIDKNNLLTIFNEKIPQTKEYTYNVGGYLFSDFDKGMIVLHKKDIKIVNLKNLWDGMNVVYVKNPIPTISKFEKNKFASALTMFHSFDEVIGKMYYFIPGLWEKDVQVKNEIFKKLWTAYEIVKDQKGMILNKSIEDKERGVITLEESLSYFFGLFILYGRFDAKWWILSSIKIQIPIFWWFMKLQEDLDNMIKILQQEWIFIKIDKLTNNNGITYQISTNDYELLEVFAKWYEPVEKFEKISKVIFTQEMKSKLLEFLENNSEIPEEGKTEVINKIKNGTIKFLTK